MGENDTASPAPTSAWCQLRLGRPISSRVLPSFCGPSGRSSDPLNRSQRWDAEPGGGLQTPQAQVCIPGSAQGTRSTGAELMASQLRTQAPRPPPPASLGMKGHCGPHPRGTSVSEALQKLPSVHAAPDISFFIDVFMIAIIQNSFSPYISPFIFITLTFSAPTQFHLQNGVSLSPESVWLPDPSQPPMRGPLSFLQPFPATSLPLSHTHIPHSFTICHLLRTVLITPRASAGDPAPALTPQPPRASRSGPF